MAEGKWVMRFTRYLHVAGFFDRSCFIVPGDRGQLEPPGRQILAWQRGEQELNLVEPPGVNGGVDPYSVGIPLGKPSDR